ncbi:hypothetical protein COT42_07925 [Candidatus Saganbacteria bacterium CG08_land_8_20_14_0_20_45_16]|uniref:Fido domain-containing protein n=1 Tax=Candidatus Saganbacteria bacterium CG08_land_8_20_14_0_20_45_16 TaxID=2014293 RepID=A0A2H0XWE6_UNCSA|nr:MAG: hypothetical protein COT42_07925 [Candidatus Saganbacteria bacterium CG08_land_8_20_14_0_20_45_16]
MVYKPIYRISPYLLNLIDKASALRSWIELAPLQVSWLPILQKEAKVRAAHSSTTIEGNQLSFHQVQAISRGEKVGAPRKDELEVKNYLNLMHWLEKNSKLKITEQTIHKMHKMIVEDLVPENKAGKYKDRQNYVINEKNIKVFTPPSPLDTAKQMKELFTWLNNPNNCELHCIILCAIFHHRFVSIHPFSDGNGRLARALGTLILYQREFDTKYIFSLDDYFAGDRKKYYLKLQQARELDNDLTLWLEYVAEGIVITLKNVKKRIEDLQISGPSQIYLTPKQEEIIRILRDHHQIRGAELISKLGVSRARVNQLLTPLIKNQIILKEGQSKATRYKLALHKT